MSAERTARRADGLLLGEWACLGLLYRSPAHGFAIASRLRPDADIGRIWSLSRALTYRSLNELAARGLIMAVAEEPGLAGGSRTILRATSTGRAAFRRWVRTPVDHLRDLRSEFLLKLVLAEENGIDVTGTIDAQRDRAEQFVAALERAHDPTDVVQLWRLESATAALRFLDRLLAGRPPVQRVAR
jgi:PadR family transcriptional regulator AphA